MPAVFLWPQRTDEVRANALIQKLRFSWLLVLQLLALLLLVCSLARPQFKQSGLAGKVTVVVLDASASMGSTDVEPSRIDVAKARIEQLIRSAAPGDRIALIEAGPFPRVIFPLSNDPQVELNGVKSVRQYDAEADVGEALRLAAAIVSTTEGSRILLLSDGVFEPVRNFSPGKASVVFQPIGESGENLGIQALGTGDGANGKLVYCGVRNFGKQSGSNSISIFADQKVIYSANISVLPNKVWGQTVNLPRGTKVIEARLGQGDSLACDNYAATVLDPNASSRVLLITSGNMFLERALALDPRVTLDKAAKLPESEKAVAPGESQYDIVVFDGLVETGVKSKGVLSLGSTGNSSIVQFQGSSKNPELVSSDEVPLLAGVNFEEIYVEKFQRVTAIGQGRAVAETKSGPMLVVANGNKRQIYLAFSPLDSDFPLNVGFPIFIGNALDFLIGKERSDNLSLGVAQPLTISVAKGDSVTLTREGDPKVEIQVRDERATVRETYKVGKYELTSGKTKKSLYAYFRNSAESTITPKSDIELGQTNVVGISALSRFEDFWRPLLIALLALLCFEWWAFARRS